MTYGFVTFSELVCIPSVKSMTTRVAGSIEEWMGSTRANYTTCHKCDTDLYLLYCLQTMVNSSSTVFAKQHILYNYKDECLVSDPAIVISELVKVTCNALPAELENIVTEYLWGMYAHDCKTRCNYEIERCQPVYVDGHISNRSMFVDAWLYYLYVDNEWSIELFNAAYDILLNRHVRDYTVCRGIILHVTDFNVPREHYSFCNFTVFINDL